MKKLILAGLISLIAVGAWSQASAPVNNSSVRAAKTNTTISADWTGTWTYVDSIVVLKTDTCYVRYSLTGTATLFEGDKLYLGLIVLDTAEASGGADRTAVPTDTVILEWPLGSLKPSNIFNFGMTIQDSLISTTDSTSRCYFTAAVKSSSKADIVIITTSTLSTGLIIESR